MVEARNRIQPEYLWTLADLYRVSLGNLGPMDTKPFQQFKKEMAKVAQEKAVKNPRMAIDISLKQLSEFGATEQPYPISEDEWEVFINDSRTMANFMPNVHVVDGDKYTLPI